MPQSLKEVLKEKTIFDELKGKTPADKLKVLVSLTMDLTRGILFERKKDAPETNAKNTSHKK